MFGCTADEIIHFLKDALNYCKAKVSGKICLEHASRLKPWSHDPSKSTLKSIQNFTNKSLTWKINKDQMEVRASFLFHEDFELPVQADSSQERLAPCSPWKNRGHRISKHQPSTNGREKKIITNCSSAVAADIVGGASDSQPEMRRGKM